MVWAALVSILLLVVITATMLVLVQSFGAFTSTLERHTDALLRTSTENVLVHAHNDEIAEKILGATRQLRRATEVLSDKSFGMTPPSPSDQERSA